MQHPMIVFPNPEKHIKSFWLAPLFLVSMCFLFGCEKKVRQPNFPPYSVGHIPFSKKLDNPDFQLCNESYIVENGGRRSAYKGGVS